MILLYILVGLLTGSLLNWVADYAPRFAASDAAAPRPSSPRPALAVWHLLKSLSSHAILMRLPATFWLSIAGELTAVLLFAYLGQRFGPSWKLLHLGAACSLFLLIALIDLRHRLVLNVLVYPAMGIAMIFHSAPPGRDTLVALLGGVFGLLPFLAAAWLKPEGLGAGDVKLAALIGLVVGFPLVVYALLVAVLAGGITTLFLLCTHRWNLKSTIPYAPFLCLGAVFSLVCAPFFLILPH
jgi:leader peptidase (prepilin peptidase)/N-methyltransferase